MNNSSDLDRLERWWIAGIEQGSILAILIIAITRIVCVCFHKMAGIVGVVHSNPNDPNHYMETRLDIITFHKFEDVLYVMFVILSFLKKSFI